ncbi:MAG TPA: WecB/TagA/CpsF family glycosyltransferase [Anaerolineae bacterium]|nr:WecB/TagA/CpsF family glycosyltransferase [Anaerolineae bacterium]HQK13574.1 WecB/TagA/CpsF family glycosyltransferase [Anaerolineae bacterium]
MAGQRVGFEPDVVTLMGVPIHNVTTAETLALVGRWIAEGGAHQIATVNPEFLMMARRDANFRATLQRAALCVPDGIGVLWAARLRGKRLRERVAGSDLVPLLSAEAARHGWRVFYLGAAPGVAEKAAAILAARHPGLIVAGCYAGSPAIEEEEAIIARVRAAQADLLFVAYGAPGQDVWLGRNLVRTGAAVGIGVGGSFDFIAGISRRAPRWIQRLGLEWFYRLVREPWRWRRQLALPQFAWLILTGRDAPRDTSGIFQAQS